MKETADPYFWARALTVPFAALLGWAVHDLVRGERPRTLATSAAAWLVLVLLAFDTDLVVAAICGLETFPHVALVVAGFALYRRERNGDARAAQLTIPCFVAVALMRIDGFAPLALILAWELGASLLERRVGGPRSGSVATSNDFERLLRWAGPGVGVYLAWFIWRCGYYGLPLPTTYYAKALIPVALPHHGSDYVRDFWLSTGLFAAVPFAMLAAVRGRRELLPPALFVALHSLYVIRVGGDWMPFFRFMAPLVPLVLVLMARGALELFALVRPRAAVIAFAVASLAVAAWIARRVDGHSIETDVERDKMNTVNVLAHVIDDNFEPSAQLLAHALPAGRRIVTDYAGVMAYFTDAEVIDMWGLCNQEIALFGTTDGVNPIWGKTCPACYPDLRPDFFHVPGVGAVVQFEDRPAVVAAVWQSKAIGRYVDFGEFAAGRVIDQKKQRAIYFLERRRRDSDFAKRRPAPGIVVDYPFEVGGGG